jgi:hypothetical protein
MHIPEHVIDGTWRSVGALEPAAMRRIQKSSGKDQEDLMAFVMAWNSEQRSEVLGLGLYLALVILESFRRGPVRKVKRVKERQILKLIRENQALIAALPDSPEEGSAVLKDSDIVSEPAIMEYILSALAEIPEDPDEALDLSNDEFWHLVLVLKTFTDALHEASHFDTLGEEHAGAV